jgi:hypothetical protein
MGSFLRTEELTNSILADDDNYPVRLNSVDKFDSIMYTSFLPLGATAQGELWPPEQSASVRITW